MGACAAFDIAYDDFLKALPEHEKLSFAPCASADDLLAGIKKLDTLGHRRQQGRSARLLESVKKVTDRLQAYFTILDTVIQCDPQYAAIAWGACKFVLLLAGQYASFLEKLVKMLGNLADALPALSKIPEAIATSSSMQNLLKETYTDILKIFRISAQVFTNRKGSMRKTPAIIADILWTPFDVRYKDILDDLKIRKELIFDEVLVLQAQSATDAEFRAAEERKQADIERHLAACARKHLDEVNTSSSTAVRMLREQAKVDALQRIRDWLAGSDYGTMFWQYQGVREDGTNFWLFQENAFILWLDLAWAVRTSNSRLGFSQNILWLQGNPGTGKSVLASSVIRHIQDAAQRQQTPIQSLLKVYYFFFQAGNNSRNTSNCAWRSILRQVLDQHIDDADALDLFLFALDDLKESTFVDGLIDLLGQHLNRNPHAYFILDGIDECEDSSSLIKQIRLLSSLVPVKFFLVSRPNIATLQRKRNGPASLTMSRDRVGEDIETYAVHQLQDFLDEGSLPFDADVKDLAQHIRKGADGMFLWASLMCRYLQSPALTPARRARDIGAILLPEGLEAMYNRILSLLSASGETQQLLARQILLWTSHADLSIDARLVEQAVLLAQGDDPEEIANRFEDFSETAVVSCGGLIEAGAGNELFYVHLSLREHLDQIRGGRALALSFPRLLLLPHSRPVEVVCVCLGMILRAAPQDTIRPTTYRGVLKKRLATVPLLSYACRRLAQDLASMHRHEDDFIREEPSDQLQTLASKLLEFTRKPLAITLWLEALYTNPATDSTRFGVIQSNIQALRRWSRWILDLQRTKFSDLLLSAATRTLDVCDDLADFTAEWHTALQEDPVLLYDETILLSKRSKFLFAPKVENIHFLNIERPRGSNSSEQPLCISSATNTEGTYTVVVTIWSSPDFEARWRSLDPMQSCSQILHLCNGWISQIDIWSTEDKPKRELTLHLALDESELALQLRQSLRMGANKEWKTSFPIYIHADSKSVVILRSVYRLLPDQVGETFAWKSTKLPLDFTPLLRSKWTDQLADFDPASERLKKVPPTLHFLYRDWYTYHVSLSADGSFVFFADYHPSFFSHVAVFSLTTDNSFQASLLASDGFRNNENLSRRPPIQALFCSTTLLAFAFPESVWFWDFMHGGEAYPERVSVTGISSLTMSVCHNYVVATTEQGAVIVPISASDTSLHSENKSDRRNRVSRILRGRFELGSSSHRTGHLFDASTKGKVPSLEPKIHTDRTLDMYALGDSKRAKHRLELDAIQPHVRRSSSQESVRPVPADHITPTVRAETIAESVTAVTTGVAKRHGEASSVAIVQHIEDSMSSSAKAWKLLRLPDSLSRNDTFAQLGAIDGDTARIRIYLNKRTCEEAGFNNTSAAPQSVPTIVDRTLDSMLYQEDNVEKSADWLQECKGSYIGEPIYRGAHRDVARHHNTHVFDDGRSIADQYDGALTKKFKYRGT